jgi:GTP-binding protein
MKITSAEFILGVANLRQLPNDGRKEVAFLGRSNVGKSSLLNRLCGRKALARSSSEPGKTRELNFYLISDGYYFVDLPGYGYARAPEQIRSGWGKLVEEYLKKRKELCMVVQLIDARHEPTPLDVLMVGWLEYYEIPFLVALTKADKLPRSKMGAYMNEARRMFARHAFCRGVFPFSSVTGEGKQEVLSVIAHQLDQERANDGITK